MPQGMTVVQDIVHGEISFDNSTLEDFIILKATGMATYHLASVVDDHEMKITHVLRGKEWLSSLPKHCVLYRSFGWVPPLFAHLPLILNEDKSKLSKRCEALSIHSLLEKGYLPSAIVEYVSTLGYSADLPAKDAGRLTIQRDLIKNFHLSKIKSTDSCFDMEKLNSINKEHLLELFANRNLYPNDFKTLVEILKKNIMKEFSYLPYL
ncbi:glutamate--tRNA ligase-like [Zophobas morio]|uniref:glutamate--tRNA ligase-like n=1 Tax=Zophobas morio TaxID=2755281 RepID=UPI003082E2A4